MKVRCSFAISEECSNTECTGYHEHEDTCTDPHCLLSYCFNKDKNVYCTSQKRKLEKARTLLCSKCGKCVVGKELFDATSK